MTIKQINKKCVCLAKKLTRCGRTAVCSGQQAPLSKACRTGRFRICKVNGDRKQCARMASMGVMPGKEAELICSQNGSQCLLKVHGGTLSLDQSMSENIIVESV